mmetsp:Transcript_43876/g.139832  ORF Transcript_43876/g.139832 Transcript_43876/m.139832 type:complete len:218 (-) Transcript_43876:386-1039(-)
MLRALREQPLLIRAGVGHLLAVADLVPARPQKRCDRQAVEAVIHHTEPTLQPLQPPQRRRPLHADVESSPPALLPWAHVGHSRLQAVPSLLEHFENLLCPGHRALQPRGPPARPRRAEKHLNAICACPEPVAHTFVDPVPYPALQKRREFSVVLELRRAPHSHHGPLRPLGLLEHLGRVRLDLARDGRVLRVGDEVEIEGVREVALGELEGLVQPHV